MSSKRRLRRKGCRGWTLGDAPATPHSLGDVNDNFSLVGARWLASHHTAARWCSRQEGCRFSTIRAAFLELLCSLRATPSPVA